MKRNFLKLLTYGTLLVLVLVLGPAPSRADSYSVSVVTSSVIVTTVSEAGNPSNIIATSINGIGVVNVFDTVPSFLGPVELGNTTLTFGNAVVYESDYPGLTQAVADTLDFSAANFSGSVTQILGTGSVAVGPITDPALAMFLDNPNFGFTLANSSVNGDNQTVSQWNLTSITATTPEPGSLTFLLFGTGLLGCFVRRRKSS